MVIDLFFFFFFSCFLQAGYAHLQLAGLYMRSSHLQAETRGSLGQAVLFVCLFSGLDFQIFQQFCFFC